MRVAPLARSALLLLCIARGSLADEVSARLVWQRSPGAESCIDAAALQSAVNGRWQRQVFVDAPTADLIVDGKVGRTGRKTWSASIEMRRADGQSLGTRELVTHSASCSALDEPVALALGIMLDVSRKRVEEERAAGAAAAPKESDVVSGPAISIPEKPPAPPAPPAAAREHLPRRWHVEPFGAVEGFVGILPSFDIGGRFGFSVTPPERFRVELSASVYPPKDASPGRPTARLDAWAAELAVFPFAFYSGRLRGDVGAGVRLVQIHADGLGLDQNGSADKALVGLGLRAGLAFRVTGPLELLAGMGGTVSLSRYRFLYRTATGGAAAVYETGPVSAEMFLGLGLWL